MDIHLRVHLLPFFGDKPIGAIRTSAVRSWITDRTKVLGPRSVEAVYDRLATIFRAAVFDKVVSASPCPSKKIINLPKVVKVPVVPLAVEEVEALAEAVPDRYRALIVVGFGLGLRQGECFGLALDRVDFLRRSVRVDQQVCLPNDGPQYLTPKLKSDASYRTPPLPDVVGQALASHLEQFPPGVHGLLFTDKDGDLLNRKRYDEMLNRAVKASGIRPGTTSHDLRHFYASALIFAGQSVKVVQERLGHASATETMDTYGHLWPDDEDGTRTAIDNLFAPRTVAKHGERSDGRTS